MSLTNRAPTTRPVRPLWHAFVWIIGLSLLCGAVNALYPLVMSQQARLHSATAGDLLYISTFDAFDDEWQTYQGRLSAQITEGVLRLEVGNAPNLAYSASLPIFQDAEVSLSARASDGPIDNGYGIIFRLQEQSNDCDMPLKILCDLAQIDALGVPLRLLFRPQTPLTGYYLFMVSSDGYYSVWRAEGDSPKRVSTWIPSDAIRQGLDAENHLRVVMHGDEFSFFINDSPVELCIPDDPNAESTYSAGQCLGGTLQSTWRDSRFQEGKVGVVAHATQTGGAGVVIDFEHLIVTMPRPAQEGDRT